MPFKGLPHLCKKFFIQVQTFIFLGDMEVFNEFHLYLTTNISGGKVNF